VEDQAESSLWLVIFTHQSGADLGKTHCQVEGFSRCGCAADELYCNQEMAKRPQKVLQPFPAKLNECATQKEQPIMKIQITYPPPQPVKKLALSRQSIHILTAPPPPQQDRLPTLDCWQDTRRFPTFDC
jgi:hypothetical protein